MANDQTGSVRLYQRRDESQATDAERHHAASAGPYLQPMLGVAIERRRLLAPHVNWDRVWFLERDGELVGHMQAYIHGRGPHRVKDIDLRAEFGLMGAMWRRRALALVDGHFARFEAYICRFILQSEVRGQGLAPAMFYNWLDAISGEQLNQVHCEVWGNYRTGIRWHESFGFTREKAHRLPFPIPGLPARHWTLLSRSAHRESV